MRSTAWFAVVVVSALLTGGCGTPGPLFINDPYSRPDKSDDVDELLEAWLNCDECQGGQLRRVQELGDTAVAALQSIAAEGFIPKRGDRLSAIAASCQRVNARMVDRGLTPAETQRQCEARYLANLQRRHQSRATEALLAIRTPSACRVVGESTCLRIPPFHPALPGVGTDRSLRRPGLVAIPD